MTSPDLPDPVAEDATGDEQDRSLEDQIAEEEAEPGPGG